MHFLFIASYCSLNFKSVLGQLHWLTTIWPQAVFWDTKRSDSGDIQISKHIVGLRANMPTSSTPMLFFSGNASANIWNLHGPVGSSSQNLVANIYKQTYVVSGANATGVPVSASCAARNDACVGSSPASIAGSNITIVAEDSLLVRAINSNTLDPIWSTQLIGPNASIDYHAMSPLVTPDNSAVCVTFTSWNATLLGMVQSFLRCLNTSNGNVTFSDDEPSLNTPPSSSLQSRIFSGTLTGWRSVVQGQNFESSKPGAAAAPVLLLESSQVGYVLQRNCFLVVFNLSSGAVVQENDMTLDCTDLTPGGWPYTTDMPLLSLGPSASNGVPQRLFAAVGNHVVAFNIGSDGSLSRFWMQKVSTCGFGVPLATDSFGVYFLSCSSSSSTKSFYFQSLPLNGPNNGLALAIILGIGIPILLVAIAIAVVLWKRFSTPAYEPLE